MFRDASISESDEEQPGLIFDYDSDRRIVGIEILDAAQNIGNPRAIDGFVAVANHR